MLFTSGRRSDKWEWLFQNPGNTYPPFRSIIFMPFSIVFLYGPLSIFFILLSDIITTMSDAIGAPLPSIILQLVKAILGNA